MYTKKEISTPRKRGEKGKIEKLENLDRLLLLSNNSNSFSNLLLDWMVYVHNGNDRSK